MGITPPSDFLKYLDQTVGAPANIIAANPLHYNGSTGQLYIDQASGGSAGYISTGSQVIAGQKTFLIPPLGVSSQATSIQSTTANTPIDTTNTGSDSFWNFRADPSSTYANELRIFGLGDDTTTNSEYLQLGYTPTKYEIKTNKAGSGTIRNMDITVPTTNVNGDISLPTDGVLYFSNAFKTKIVLLDQVHSGFEYCGISIASHLTKNNIMNENSMWSIYSGIHNTATERENFRITAEPNSTSYLFNTAQASDISTGALCVMGGQSIQKNLYVGQDIHCNGTIYGTLSSSGSPVPFSFGIGGAIISPNMTGTFNKFEGQVVINFDAISNSSIVSATIYTASGAIPVDFRPSIDQYCPLLVLTNSAVSTGTVELRADGTIIVYDSSHSNFSSSGNAGIMRCSCIYRQ